MSLFHEFSRVSKRGPCSICGKPDWCLRAADGSDRAVCARIPSSIRWGDSGWLHGGVKHSEGPRVATIEDAPDLEWWKSIAKTCRLRLLEQGQLRGSIAMKLGVTVESMDALGVGLDRDLSTTTWPMCDHLGHVIGIRLRTSMGKRAIKGSRNGLFLPEGSEREVALACEGESDTAAALTLGFFAIGRPGCRGGTQHLLRWLAVRPGRLLIVVADADVAGRQGAQDLADLLAPLAMDVRVIEPPLGAKDLRAALIAGATYDDVLRSIEAAPRVIPTLQVRRTT